MSVVVVFCSRILRLERFIAVTDIKEQLCNYWVTRIILKVVAGVEDGMWVYVIFGAITPTDLMRR